MRPLRPSDLVAPGLCAVGLVLVFLGYDGAASRDRVEAQFPYLLSGGILGLCLVVMGTGVLVAGSLRRAEEASRQRSEDLRRSFEDVLAALAVGMTGAVGVTGADGRTGPEVPGAPREPVSVLNATYHRPGCQVLAGRTGLRRVDPEAAALLGFAPCRVCSPESPPVAVPVEE